MNSESPVGSAPPANERQIPYLFVYGTLMTGEIRHRLLAPARIRSIVTASVAGELLNLGGYPGLQRSSNGHGRVRGELIEFQELDEILSALDAEEGPEYRREILTVTPDNGPPCRAYAYLLTGEGLEFPAIHSGDWRVR